MARKEQDTRHIAAVTYNSTSDSVIAKIYTHSLLGFSTYVKNQIIEHYNNRCTIEHCYSCRCYEISWFTPVLEYGNYRAKTTVRNLHFHLVRPPAFHRHFLHYRPSKRTKHTATVSSVLLKHNSAYMSMFV